MRRIALAASLLALVPATAHADRDSWRGILIGSFTAAAAGATALIWGHHSEQQAFEKLDTSSDPMAFADADRQASRAKLISTAGAFTLAIGGLATFIAAYEYLNVPDSRSRVTIAPLVTPHSGGAAVSLRF